MAFTQQSDDGQLDGRMLADQHALNIAAQPLGDGLHRGGHTAGDVSEKRFGTFRRL
jgi:hypothetical protein